MRKLYSVLLLLFVAAGCTYAQTYNANDSLHLHSFLMQNSADNSYNYEKLSLTSADMIDGTWIGKLTKVDWKDSAEGKRIKNINMGDLGLSGSLDVSGCTSLETFYCSGNSLSSLDVSRCSALQFLDCSGNPIGALDMSNCPDLMELHCSGTSLNSLDLSGCLSLSRLLCSDNNLSSLDISNRFYFKELYCGGNNLSTLDISGNPSLELLYCGNNSLTSIDVNSYTRLTTLNCSDNSLSSINIEGCSALKYLICNGNDLSSVDITGCSSLKQLDCRNNYLPFSSLPLSLPVNSGFDTYQYAPQKEISLGEISAGNPLDLTAELSIGSVSYQWTADNVNIDLSHTGSGFFDVSEYGGKTLSCSMTNDVFPKFDQSPLVYTVKPIFTTVSVDTDSQEATVLRVESGVLYIQSVEPVLVGVYTLSGVLAFNDRVNGFHSVSLTQGVYIVTIDGKSQKVVIP